MQIAGYELNRLYNEDCLQAMKKMPDKCFDLAIVDPPYGGGQNETWQTRARSRFGGLFDKYEIKCARTGGGWFKDKYGKDIQHWDVAPSQEYFDELFRISKNQIIWGGNYFNLPPTRCFLVWRKLTISEKFSMAMCEYAWTSFNENAKWIELPPQGSAKEQRFHPTQKPIALYKWALCNYAKPGDKILDTHGGSFSSAIACHDLGYEYLVFEIDKHYFDLGEERVNKHKAQISIFDLATES